MLLSKPVKKLYTLHKASNKQPFVFHIMQHDDTIKTTLMSFTHRKDAHLMGNVFEAHYKLYGSFPNNQFTYERPLDISFDTKDENILDQKALQETFIEELIEEETYNFCANNQLDLMIISNLEEQPSLKIISFELPIELLKEKFEENFK